VGRKTAAEGKCGEGKGGAQTPWRVHEREGKKGGLKEGER